MTTQSHPIDETIFVPVNGQDQALTVRGHDRSNPALMMIGGPGVAFSGAPAMFEAWEGDFTLVHWDQPGAGATYDRHGAPEPYSFERLAADGTAVAEAAVARLGVQRLTLMGVSGGSIVGLMMARARPDLFSAYVGTGQVVNWAEQEALGYAAALDGAQRSSDTAAVEALTRIGPPPWADFADELTNSIYVGAPTIAEQAAFATLGPALAKTPSPFAHDVRTVAGAAFARLKPQFAAFDAHDLGAAFDIPMIFLQGAQDLRTPAPPVAAYAAKLAAPRVVYDEIAEAGHSAYLLTDLFLPRLKAHLAA